MDKMIVQWTNKMATHRLTNSEDANRFLRGLGLIVGEDVVQQVLGALQEKASLYRLYKPKQNQIPVCGKGTVYKIKRLYESGQLEPYLTYLKRAETSAGKVSSSPAQAEEQALGKPEVGGERHLRDAGQLKMEAAPVKVTPREVELLWDKGRHLDHERPAPSGQAGGSRQRAADYWDSFVGAKITRYLSEEAVQVLSQFSPEELKQVIRSGGSLVDLVKKNPDKLQEYRRKLRNYKEVLATISASDVITYIEVELPEHAFVLSQNMWWLGRELDQVRTALFPVSFPYHVIQTRPINTPNQAKPEGEASTKERASENSSEAS